MSDSDTRIKDLPLASTVANDDYIAIDGVANDTRRYKVKDITDSVDAVAGDVTTINNKIGSTTLPTTAQTLTGAISEVVSESGTAVATSMNGSTYVVTVQLKNAAGTVVSSGTVDLPFENTITNGSYSNETLTLTKMGGSTVSIDLSSLSGKAEVMTEDEWDDLPSSKLTDGKVYALSGVSPSTQDNPLWQKLGFAALDTTADDCSDAINELNTGLTTLNSNIGILRAKYYTVASTVTNQKIALSNILLQAYNDIAGETLVNVFCFTWEATNSGCGMISPDRRFIILCGGTLFFGVIRTDGTFTSYRQASYTEP